MIPHLHARWLATIALATSLVASCAATDSKSDSKADSPTTALSAQGFQSVLAATDLSGKRVGPASDDKRATLFVVFASWCGPCRHELKTLAQIRKAEPRLRIIGLNAYEDWGDRSDEKRLRAFLADNAPWLQAVHADPKLLAAFGGVTKIPTVFVYDKAGNLVQEFRRSQRAPATKPELEAAITKAIAAQPAG